MSASGAETKSADEFTLYAIAGHRGGKQREIIEAVGPSLQGTLAKWGILPGIETALFLGQCAVESAGFSTMREFASGKEYEGRVDLGNTHPGDGVKYKGRGWLEVTGLDNYRRCGAALGLDLVNHPELLEDYQRGLEASCWFWMVNRIGPYARKGDVLSVSRIINLGSATKKRMPNGWDDRQLYTRKARAALGV
jgi:putative chitinase